MENICTLIAVRDIEKAKQFYMDVLGLEVISDFGANVILSGGVTLQTIETWQNFIRKREDEIILGSHAYELYFEEDDLDAFAARLEQFDHIKYVHTLIEHSWGQRAIRFYDPDQHIIEVGESIHKVIRRFLDSGLTVQETAAHMDVPLSYIERYIDSKNLKSKSLNHYIREYRTQLQKGCIQHAYQGILSFMLGLKGFLECRHPEYYTSSVYFGYMDMTYVAFTPPDLKKEGLKIAIVYLHEKGIFEIWLAANNRKIQAEYIEFLNNKISGKYKLSTASPGVDSIVESILNDEPDFDHQEQLKSEIEKRAIDFINDIVSLRV